MNSYQYGLEYEKKFLQFLEEFIENEIIATNTISPYFYCDFCIKDKSKKIILSIEIKTRNHLDRYDSIFLSSSKFNKFNEYKKTNNYNKNANFIIIWYDIQNRKYFFTEIKEIISYHNSRSNTSNIPKSVLKYGNKDELQEYIKSILE